MQLPTRPFNEVSRYSGAWQLEVVENIVRHGSNINPHNRFDSVRREADWQQLDEDEQAALDGKIRVPIEYIADSSQSVVSENQSPDIPFRYSLNPYRGCIHGCSYCYARPTHEYLGFSAGLYFETKIVVKVHAPALLLDVLLRPH